jgi:GH18 family chitinase
MKIAIVGSRSFTDYEKLRKFILDHINIEDISLVVSGGAIGADTLAEKFAKEYSIEKKIFIPQWDTYGKKAGFMRNIDIVKSSDIVFAFWDGQSKGTKSTITLASEYDKVVHVYVTR